MSNHCATLVVDDAPADEDEFGSHKPIVDAIQDLFENEKGGKTIGLEGGWGSGKSTVAKLLASRTNGRTSHLFLFDTWAHEGDPLRRSFLEELIRSLIDKSWIDDQSWKDRREELAKRRRVERTRPVAKLERPAIAVGIVAAILLMLIPIAAELINAGLSRDQLSIGPLASGGSLGFAFLVIVLVVGWLLWSGRLGPKSSAWISLFSVHSVTESDRETIETPDPTSIEFESTFKDLMRCALGKHHKRRLILVIDNLDRVTADDARSIWATLQTFLHHSHSDREPWLDSLWVLIPYDRKGIERLWDSSGENDRSLQDPSIGSLAESFIEKSIQVRFEVPLPLLSDWRGYLESKLELALPEHDRSDFYGVYRLYAWDMTRKGRAPTPRELKQYVNRIGSLHRRWKDSVPLSSLAYHALLNRSSSSIADELRAGELPDAVLSGLLQENVARHLAAIAFNTDERRAQQLLLEPIIERALTLGEPDELEGLLDRTGFWEILPQVRFAEWDSELPSLLAAAARLSEIPEDRRPESEWQEIRSALSEASKSVEAWPQLNPSLARDLEGLLFVVDEESSMRIAISASEGRVQGDEGTDWADGARQLLTRFDKVSVRGVGDDRAIYSILGRLGSFSDAKNLVTRVEIPIADKSSLVEVISEGIVDSPRKARHAIEFLKVKDEGYVDWDVFCRSTVSVLGNTVSTNLADSQDLLAILRLAGDSGWNMRTDLVNQGIALHYVGFASEQANDKVLGEWLYEEFLRYPSPAYHNPPGHHPHAPYGRDIVGNLLSNPAHEAIGLLAAEVGGHRNYEIIDSLASDSSSNLLASALIARLWSSRWLLDKITSARLMDIWQHVSGNEIFQDDDLSQFVGMLCRRAEFISELKSNNFSIDRMSMYAALLGNHTDRSVAVDLVDWVVTSLTKLSREQWSTAMHASDDWVRLLVAIRRVDDEGLVGGQFGLALGEFVEGVAGGEEVSDLITYEWEKTVVASMAPTIRGIYEEGVFAAAVNVEGQLPETYFSLTGQTLRKPAILARPQILNGVLPQLASSQNQPGLSWLLQTLKDGDVLKDVPEGGFDPLAEVVSVSLEQTGDDSDLLRGIADILSVSSDN